MIRFNNDSGANYAWTFGDIISAASESAGQNYIPTEPGSSNGSTYTVADIVNVSNMEKLYVGNTVANKSSGAGNAPKASICYAKWANTSAQINRIDITNIGAGDFYIGSELVVLGHN